ncbi:MAG: hypothetical protein HGA45_29245, partial [Chloroflexales bacterium]|nr:hypothetical protein [Chloroflexales bacterium]
MKHLLSFWLLALVAALGAVGPALAQLGPGAAVREGMLRGARVRVIDVGRGTLRAEVEGLGPVANPGDLAAFDTRPFTTGAPSPDPITAGQAWRVRVAAPGMQSLGVGALAAAGLNLGQSDPAGLRLYHRGQEVALEEVRSGGALVELRFFAEPGDRWNSDAVYWLTAGSGPGLRMATADATPQSAAGATTAVERGVWRANTVYDSRLPGPDADHFFSADLGAYSPPEAPDVVTATLAPRLQSLAPPALTLRGETAEEGSFLLCVRAGPPPETAGYTPCADPAQPELVVSWSGKGAWERTATMPAFDPRQPVLLIYNLSPGRVSLDGVTWEMPVSLALGERGASFVGRAETVYTLLGKPAGAAVYDLGGPAPPTRLLFSGDTFQTAAGEPRPYLVTGEGTLYSPEVTAHTPVDMASPLDAEVVYIAPGAFIEALGPLLAHRRAQGLSAAAVPTEAIYDAWGYGEVSPEAIRAFLRYAAERWAVAPTVVTLVGDGTSDPRNYLGRNNINWVPPYLAMVDPWLGETACEACYAQLHGSSPLDDPLPDLAFGRIPAKSPAEAAALVAKILAYEGNRSAGAWRSVVAYVSDNADLGGNFPAALADSAALQPPGVRVKRLIYDPSAPPGDLWREPDPLRALDRSMGSFNGGAAIVHYIGHGHPFQWGYTSPPLRPDEPADRQYLLGVFGVDTLTNGGNLPVVLSMSCMTSSFQIPAFSGTSIDERLVARADGGAIAAWGSTGLGVLYGHDALQRGFYKALWAAPGQATLGALTMAGYLELFATQSCCQESVRTFALLG